MVDANPDSIRIIRHNLSITGFTEQTELYRNDAVRAVKALLKRGITVDIVFLDPPYKLHVYDSLIQLLDAGGALNDQAIIVCEHDAELQITLDIDGIQLIRHTVYGDTAITLFRKGGDS
jgi:16S rRNA (guanine966-N2)-methyltransferase